MKESIQEDKVEIKIITYKDLKDETYLQFNDKYGILNSLIERRTALLNKPTGYNKSEIASLIAVYKNTIIGITTMFLNRISVDKDEIFVQSGSSLYAHPKFKKLGVGADLFYFRPDNYEFPLGSLAAGISGQAIPLYKVLKYSLFEIPRYICLIHSKSVLEKILPLKGFLLKVCSVPIDFGLLILRKISYMLRSNRMNYSLEPLTEVSEEILSIIEEDNHKFKEVHDKKWFDWNLNYSFNEDVRNKKELFHIVSDGNVDGFILLKYKFYPIASSRGFKNVLMASLMEWGIKNGSKLTEADLKLFAIKQAEKNCDAVQIACSDKKIAKILKILGSMQMGHANMAFLTKDKSYKKEAKDINNWRIRMAAADTLID